MELNLHPEFQPHPPQTSSAATPEGSAGAVDGFSSLRKLLWGISGVYLVTNKITGHKYVGATGNIFKRWRKHVSEAARRPKCSFHRAIAEHGEVAFSVEVVEVCDYYRMREREMYWITYHDSVGEMGYNRNKASASRIGVKSCEGTGARVGAVLKGRVFTAEHKAHLKVACAGLNIGRKASAETRAKMSASQRGRVDSEETRARKRIAQQGRAPASAATRAKMSATRRGVKRGPMSEAHKEKIAAAQRGIKRKPLSEEHKAKLRAYNSARNAARLAANTTLP